MSSAKGEGFLQIFVSMWRLSGPVLCGRWTLGQSSPAWGLHSRVAAGTEARWAIGGLWLKSRPLEDELNIIGVFSPFHKYLQRVLVGCQETLVVPPALNEGKAAGLASGVCQCVHNILAGCGFCDATHNSLDSLNPHFQLHPGHHEAIFLIFV